MWYLTITVQLILNYWKKATIIVELVPEVMLCADELIKKEILTEAKIPWMRRILIVKVGKVENKNVKL